MSSAQHCGKFRDTILSDLGDVPISATQKYRVLIIRDSVTGEVVTSAQRWWRESREHEWVVGKGFKLDKQQSRELAFLLLEASSKLDNYTQN
jgi:hypothetical protein